MHFGWPFSQNKSSLSKIFSYEKTAPLLYQVGVVTSLCKDTDNREHLLIALKKTRQLPIEVEMQNKEGEPVRAMINARQAIDSDRKPLIYGILIDNTKKNQLKTNRVVAGNVFGTWHPLIWTTLSSIRKRNLSGCYGRFYGTKKRVARTSLTTRFLIWRPQPDSNRCCRRERPMSWT